MDRWWRTGVLLTALSAGSAVAMQAVADQWFPPPVSVSQYGLGPWGWLFSVFVVTMSAAPLVFERISERRHRVIRVVLLVGLFGALVMALVRTQAGGAQTSVNAQVHTVGSVVCLTFVPLGMFAVLWLQGGVGRWVAVVEIVSIEASIALMLVAAGGHDTAGLGAARSWAFWQAVASVLCVLVVVTIAVVLRPTRRRGRNRPKDHTEQPVQVTRAAPILVQNTVATRALHENGCTRTTD